jgi:hypothetical protein
MAAMTVAAILFTLVLSSCTPDVQGTYADQSGTWRLELKSGGKATFTFQGDAEDCTYSTSGKQLTVNCKEPAGSSTVTVQDDGSLAGPPGSMIPVLRKQK